MMIVQTTPTPETEAEAPQAPEKQPLPEEAAQKEYGGRGGLDPVRYGDWEKNGRCIDF
ncbi:DUF1674 domain-containing protein [Stenotrophomonas sp. JC08]|uniref:DUF1674 domain-containing protein n=1 Tax=Stenotrophomonas sp. JC08 TaxID=3445779 RepID=UPI003FA1B175